MTQQEYNDFWDQEKKVEKIIKAGKFGEMLQGKNVDYLLRQADAEKIINSTKKHGLIRRVFYKWFGNGSN